MTIQLALRMSAFVLLVAWPSLSVAQQFARIGFAQTTIDNTAGGIALPSTQTNPANQQRATWAFCTAEDGDIRWTIDGSAPTTTFGNLTLAGHPLPAIFGTQMIDNFRAIRATTTNAVLTCNYVAGGSLAFREWTPPRGGDFAGGPIEVTPSAAWAVDPCANTPEDVPIDTATSGNSQLVALSGSMVIYVCGYSFTTDDAVAVQFISGTGTACDTGETNETAAMPIATGNSGKAGVGFAGSTVFKTAAGAALCIELSAAVGVRGHISYKQQ